jgi:hypothetical protein
MKPLVMLLPPLLTVLAGCAQTTPGWDGRFGDSVRQARAQQTIDPAAGHRAGEPATVDGKAVAGAQRAYATSFGYSVREARPAALVLTPGTAAGQ